MPVTPVPPELDPDGVEPLAFDSEAWDCEAEPDAPGVVEAPGFPLSVPVTLLPPEAEPDGAEPLVFEPETWDCEAEPDAPDAWEDPVGVPVAAVEFPPVPEVGAVDCPAPVLP